MPQENKPPQDKVSSKFANGPHPTHVTRVSLDTSSYDEICVNCGARDEVPGGWGELAFPCKRQSR